MAGHRPSAHARRHSFAGIAVGALALALLPLGSVGAGLGSAAAGRDGSGRPWMDATQSPDTRAAQLLARMTLEEKVDLMTGNQGEAPYAYYNAPIPRLGIPALKMADASSGVAPRGWTLPGTGTAATAMPSMQAMGATWSMPEVRRLAAVVTAEVLETGQNVLLGPDGDIVRVPWWGRIQETQGEDPLMNATMNTAYVGTVQARHVIAALKHYAAYTQETNRGSGLNTLVDMRTLREVYTLVFESAVRSAHLGAVMCSFNKINGVYSCENALTLRTVLKGRIGFTGFVLTDFGAIHDTLAALHGGTDMETGTVTVYDGALLAAAQSGQAPISQINEACLRILRTMFRIGIFDHTYAPTSIPVAQHDLAAQRIEEQAITLLKNRRGILPLRSSDRHLAVIGADANVLASGGGAPWVQPTRSTPALQGIQQRAAGHATVRWVRGNDPVNQADMLESAGMTAVPSSVLTPAGDAGTGLTASYCTNDNFQGPAATTRTDGQVKFDRGFLSDFGAWGAGTTQYPLPPTGAASAVWTGSLTAPTTGRYTLDLSGWGDATLTVAGRTATMTGADGVLSRVDLTVDLAGGQSYPIRVTYRADHPFNGLEPGTLLLQWRTPAGALAPAIRAAARAAASSDVAIVYLRTYESEQRDRLSLKLPESADLLVRAVRAANPRTVVVLANAGPVTMPWLRSVPAVVETYYGGQEQGRALARVLWGDVNPSGKLTVTYPRSETAVPPTLRNPLANFARVDVAYREGVAVGYKGYQRYGVRPLFPFGYGLSYTRFAYSRLRLPGATSGRSPIRVRFRLTNLGHRAGAEVAQVYVRLPRRAGEPRRLVGWAKVRVSAGASRRAVVRIDPRAQTHPLGVYDTAAQRWQNVRGRYRVYVGASSQNLRLVGSFRLR
jgi:beta-glucosidase